MTEGKLFAWMLPYILFAAAVVVLSLFHSEMCKFLYLIWLQRVLESGVTRNTQKHEPAKAQNQWTNICFGAWILIKVCSILDTILRILNKGPSIQIILFDSQSKTGRILLVF